MRYFLALLTAALLVFAALWTGSWVANTVRTPHRDYNDYTVGRKMDLCGYEVDMRHAGGGYDLDRWKGAHCNFLSELDHCVLKCLANAGTVEIGAACFSDCVSE
jgi:hypothetical protein